MTRGAKLTLRIGLGVVGCIVVLGLGVVGLFASAFAGNSSAIDGAALPGGAILVKDGFSNVFILPTGVESVALIDCGVDPEAKALKARLKRKGLGLDAVQAVFLTHGHGDHIAGCKQLPHARIYAMAAEKGLVEGSASVKSPMSFLMPVPSPTGVVVSDTLRDGQYVRVGDLFVQIYALPGHTPGSAAFLARDVLYVGDGASIDTAGKLKSAAWVFSTSVPQANASLKALARRLPTGVRIEAIAPAHSGPGTGSTLLADFAAAH